MGNDADARDSASVPPPLPPATRQPRTSVADAPLGDASSGAHEKSQWITDDAPGGKWFVGCLIVLSVAGVVAAAIAGVAAFFLGF